ncbi:hypothetical protein TNCV_4798331 [Trichonephila clavipes]|nr:hypothetical protein TNCV_4798331 [Trichonephila clavipes]
MVVSISLQQFQTSDTITKRTGQGPQRIVKSEENCYGALNARHPRGMATGQSLQTLLLRREQCLHSCTRWLTTTAIEVSRQDKRQTLDEKYRVMTHPILKKVAIIFACLPTLKLLCKVLLKYTA